MASQDTAGRPDQARWTRMQVGMASPLWLPFMVAASAGAAWWTYANIARVASGNAVNAARTGAPQPAQPQASQPSSTSQAEARPAPQPQPAPQPAPAQAAAPSPEAAPPEPAAQPRRGRRSTNLAAALESVSIDQGGAGEDLIDAAYAANLGPVPSPTRKPRKSASKAAAPAPAKARKAATSPAPASASKARANGASAVPASASKAAKTASKSAPAPAGKPRKAEGKGKKGR